MDNEVLERTLREIKRTNEIIDEVVISDLAECIETINERLKKIEERHKEESEATDWQDEAQNIIDGHNHGANNTLHNCAHPEGKKPMERKIPEIKVSADVRAKTLEWADNGWHVRHIGPDGTQYLWM